MIAAPNDTALATRLQLFCSTLDTWVTSLPVPSHALWPTNRDEESTLRPKSSPVNIRVRAFSLAYTFVQILILLRHRSVNEKKKYFFIRTIYAILTSLFYSSLRNAKVVQKASGILNWFGSPCRFLSNLPKRLVSQSRNSLERRDDARNPGPASIRPLHIIDSLLETCPWPRSARARLRSSLDPSQE